MALDGDDERAGKEATGWLIALRESPDDAELRASFDAWLAASPAHRAAWAETRHLLDLVSQTRRPAAGARPSSAGRVVELRHERPRRSRRLVLAGALASLAACLILVFGPGLLLRIEASDMTATAEIRVLDLADGSIVRLGPESAIDVAFSSGERRVRLLQGEAFFEVKRDTARPFIVDSGAVRTTVVGTSFDVRRTADAIDVTVRDGVVRVSDEQATPPVSERLAAGDHVRVSGTGKVWRGTRAPDEIAAWLRREIVASDRTVSDIVDELGRYHPSRIVIADGTLGRERITGVYDLSDPPTALRAVASAHGAKVRPISPWLVVLAR